MQEIFRLEIDVNKITQTTPDEDGFAETLKDWLMVLLLVVFVLLYALAFSGKLDPFKDNSMLLRFEPVLFILAGYYFGRWPARHSEKFFRDEIARQAVKVDAAQYAKEKTQQERDSLEERIKNAKKTLMAIDPSGGSAGRQPNLEAVRSAVSILDS